MKSFTEWRANEARLYREKWGYEVSGTVAEVMKVLQQAPPDRPCTASVLFKPDPKVPHESLPPSSY